MHPSRPRDKDRREGSFMVLATARPSPKQPSQCFLIPAHTAYLGLYAKVFGPASYEQCYSWAHSAYDLISEEMP